MQKAEKMPFIFDLRPQKPPCSAFRLKMEVRQAEYAVNLLESVYSLMRHRRFNLPALPIFWQLCSDGEPNAKLVWNDTRVRDAGQNSHVLHLETSVLTVQFLHSCPPDHIVRGLNIRIKSVAHHHGGWMYTRNVSQRCRISSWVEPISLCASVTDENEPLPILDKRG